MSETGICDLCNAEIIRGEGYVFYSTTVILGMQSETGNMHICEACASRFITEEEFRKPLPETITLSQNDLQLSIMRVIELTQQANVAGIVQVCKYHGFSAAEARAKARELASLFWHDRESARLQSMAFWKPRDDVLYSPFVLTSQSTGQSSGRTNRFVAAPGRDSPSHPHLVELRLVVYAVLMAALISVLSRFAVPLSIGSITLVLPKLCVFLAGLLLGSRWGPVSVGIYVLAGALGFPVFVGGKEGLTYLFGVGGGVLLGFAASAFIVGYLAERSRNQVIGDSIAVAAGVVTFFLLCVPWLKAVSGLSWGVVFRVFVLPFLPGDLIIAVAAVLLARGIRFLMMRSGSSEDQGRLGYKGILSKYSRKEALMNILGLFGPNIEKMKLKGDVAGLIKALRHRRITVRSRAARALGDIGAQSAAPDLKQALRDFDIREEAAAALTRIGVPDEKVDQAWYWVATGDWSKAAALGEEAYEALFAELTRRGAESPSAIADALSRLGGKTAERLVGALRNADEQSKRAISATLVQMGSQATDALISELKCLNSRWSGAAAALLKQMGTPLDPDTQAWILIAKGQWDEVGKIGLPARDALKANLKNNDPSVRLNSANKLVQITQDNEAIELLGSFLHDQALSIRKFAAESLGRSRDQRAVPLLLKALNDEEIYVCAAVARALIEIGGPLVEPLRAALRSIDNQATNAAIQQMGLGGKVMRF